MENKLKAILEYAVEKGWSPGEWDMEAFAYQLEKADLSGYDLWDCLDDYWCNASEVVREPEHGLLKAIYGDKKVCINYPFCDLDGQGEVKDVGPHWEVKTRKLSTMPLEEVVNEIYNYIQNEKN